MTTLAEAEQIYSDIESVLGPYCEKIHAAGSLRRRRPFVNDIDIVAIPKGSFTLSLQGTLPLLFDQVELNGSKLARFRYKGVQIDLYYATPETWATLLLIRTGSKKHNIFLCSIARDKGWKLHANGDGLFDETKQRIAGETEHSLFEALGVPYKEPWERP